MALALLAFGCNGKRVAVVNTEMVYKESSLSEKGTQHLRSMSAEMQQTYEAAAAKVENAKGKKDKEAAQEEMQMALIEMQQRLNAEQQNVVNVLTEAYKNALDSCRTKGKFDLVVPQDVALSFDPQVDITSKVMAEMDAAPVEFNLLKPETATEQPTQ